MFNMNLKFNGAYMVASVLYGIFASKYGYRHMLSVQMLFWCAIQKYYQTPLLNTTTNYKISLSSLLDIAQNIPLCSERDLSIYTDVAERHHAHTRLYEEAVGVKSDARTSDTPAGHPRTSTSPTPTTFGTNHMHPRHTSRPQRPFYRMQHYYVPKDTHVLRQALCSNNLILANLTLFSNFLAAQQGVVPPPNSSDISSGMVVITLVGYQDGVWIARFPFGIHWGDHGIGYISHEYFDRYNRDRWIVDVYECDEPSEYRQHREKEQALGNPAQTGRLAVHMNVGADVDEPCGVEPYSGMGHTVGRGGGSGGSGGSGVFNEGSCGQRRRMCA